jgi:hypothetical protein
VCQAHISQHTVNTYEHTSTARFSQLGCVCFARPVYFRSLHPWPMTGSSLCWRLRTSKSLTVTKTLTLTLTAGALVSILTSKEVQAHVPALPFQRGGPFPRASRSGQTAIRKALPFGVSLACCAQRTACILWSTWCFFGCVNAALTRLDHVGFLAFGFVSFNIIIHGLTSPYRACCSSGVRPNQPLLPN